MNDTNKDTNGKTISDSQISAQEIHVDYFVSSELRS